MSIIDRFIKRKQWAYFFVVADISIHSLLVMVMAEVPGIEFQTSVNEILKHCLGWVSRPAVGAKEQALTKRTCVAENIINFPANTIQIPASVFKVLLAGNF